MSGQAPTGRRGRRTLTAVGLPVAGIVLFLGLWWLALTLLVPPSSFLARFAPDLTVRALVQLVVSGEIWPHVLASLRRVVIGLLLSAAVGIPLGLAVGSLPLLARTTGPVFQFIRMVSPLSWTPLAIILLGVGDSAVYFLITIGAMWPIVLNTSAAVMALDPRWITVGRSLGANRWEIAQTIVWPAIRPQVLTGLRLAVGLAWIILVPAEMLGVDSGLGYFILDTRDRLAYPELMAAIIVIGLCGFVIDSVTRWLFRERRTRARTGGRPATTAPTTAAPTVQGASRHGGPVAQGTPVRFGRGE